MRNDLKTCEGKIYAGLQKLIRIRKENSIFASGNGSGTEILDVENDHVFGYVRHKDGRKLVILANFTEREQAISENRLFEADEVGLDLITDASRLPGSDVILNPYQFIWVYV